MAQKIQKENRKPRIAKTSSIMWNDIHYWVAIPPRKPLNEKENELFNLAKIFCKNLNIKMILEN